MAVNSVSIVTDVASLIVANQNTVPVGATLDTASFKVPASSKFRIASASYVQKAGTVGVVVELQLVRNGVTVTLLRVTSAALGAGYSPAYLNIPLKGNDTVQWFLITGQATATGDFTIGLEEY